jgi:hypothetical protein
MTKYAGDPRRGLVPFGQMEGDIFLQVLLDLKREGWTEQAGKLESDMKARADLWKEQARGYRRVSRFPTLWDAEISKAGALLPKTKFGGIPGRT